VIYCLYFCLSHSLLLSLSLSISFSSCVPLSLSVYFSTVTTKTTTTTTSTATKKTIHCSKTVARYTTICCSFCRRTTPHVLFEAAGVMHISTHTDSNGYYHRPREEAVFSAWWRQKGRAGLYRYTYNALRPWIPAASAYRCRSKAGDPLYTGWSV